jgi:hypothetical protein
MLSAAVAPVQAAAGPFDVIFAKPAGVWNTYGTVGAAIHKDGKFILFTCSPDLGLAGSFGFSGKFKRSFEGQTGYKIRASMDGGPSEEVDVEGGDQLTDRPEVHVAMPGALARIFVMIFSKANNEVKITISPRPNEADGISTVFSARGATKALRPLAAACPN